MFDETMSVLIVEDEKPARDLLIDFLLRRDELKLSGMAANGKEALEMLLERHYDILFLDIALPVISGIELLEKIDYFPQVIFTSAYDKYAIRAFELGAVDYLLKPFTFERFNQAVEKVLAGNKNSADIINSIKSFGLSFREEGKHYIIAFDDILYLSSNARHTVIHTLERDFETSQLLKDICHKLPDGLFVRVHKRYCVNLKYVSKFEYMLGGQYEITLKDYDNTTLPVGKSFSSVLRDKLKI